jgi:xylulokinase
MTPPGSEVLIGLDLGTSSVKAVLTDPTGEVLAAREATHPLANPRPGWLEQNPDDWWRATQEVLRALAGVAAQGRRQVIGIGLSGQMNGAVLLDARRRPVRPCIIWADSRTARQCDEIHARIPPPELVAITGKLAVTGYTAPKLLWVREHEAALFAQVRHVLLPKDYIRLRLTDELATDPSDASNTLLFDIRRGEWSDPILRALELPPALVPPVRPSGAVVATLTRDAAGLLGLSRGVPVVAGAGDSIAEAVGNGAVGVGPILSVIGSAGNISASSDQPVIDPAGRLHTGCHAVADRWILTGVQQAAGLSMRWLFETLWAEDVGSEGCDLPSYETLVQQAASVPPGAEGIIFLPYLNGERTPHLDPHARGVFFGIAAHHKRGHLARAVLEGVAFAQRDSLELLKELRIPAVFLIASGGGARSQLWRQILADVSGLAVRTPANVHGAALGAALLAGVGVGVCKDVDGACRAAVRLDTVASPQTATCEAYDRAYGCFRHLYSQLRPVFAEAAQAL